MHRYIDGKHALHHLSGYTPFTLPIVQPARKPSIELTVKCNATLGEGWFYEGGGLYRPVHLIQTPNKLHLEHDGIFVSSTISGRLIQPEENPTAACSESGIQCTPGSNKGGGGECVTVDYPTPTLLPPTIKAGAGAGAGAGAITTVAAKVDVRNDAAEPASFKISVRVFNPHGALVSAGASEEAVVVNGTDSATTRVSIAVANATLWSIDAPRLYTLEVTLEQASPETSSKNIGAATVHVDAVNTTFGIRKIKFDEDSGMYMNGQRVELHGVAMHQDLGGLGTAVPDALQEYRIQALKDIGVNAWRCAHNPPTPALLAAADKLGMAVMVENRRFGPEDSYDKDHRAPPVTAEEIAVDVVAMVRAHRNNPSVVIWSLCNEEGCFEQEAVSAQGNTVGAAMKQLIMSHDGSRNVMAAMNDGMAYSSPNKQYPEGAGYALSSVLDVQGVNYQYPAWDSWHSMRPNQPMLNSESAACTCARGVYSDTFTATTVHQGAKNCLELDGCIGAITMEGAWGAAAARKYMAGVFVWSGFDYRGEPSLLNSGAGTWPAVSSSWGILDLVGFKKDMAFAYESWWTSPKTSPMVHLVPANWNDPNPNATASADGGSAKRLNVWAYSNADSVELFLNGKSLGTKKVPANSHVAWDDVQWAPGTLKAHATMAGTPAEPVAIDVIQTSGKTAALKMSLDWPKTPLAPNGKGAAMVKVEAVDAKGLFVPDANVRVDFKVVSGPGVIIGVGNGDPSSHQSDKATFRSTFNGLARCIVQTTIATREQAPGGSGGAEAIVLEATAETAAGRVATKLTIQVE